MEAPLSVERRELSSVSLGWGVCHLCGSQPSSTLLHLSLLPSLLASSTLAPSLLVPNMLASSIHFGLLVSIQSVALFPVGVLTDPNSRPKSAAQLTAANGSPVASQVDSCSRFHIWRSGPLVLLVPSLRSRQHMLPVRSWHGVPQFLCVSGPQFLCCIIIQWQPPVSMTPQTSLLASSSPALLPAPGSDHPSASSPAFLPVVLNWCHRPPEWSSQQHWPSGVTPYVQSSSCPFSICSALLGIFLPCNQEAGLKDAVAWLNQWSCTRGSPGGCWCSLDHSAFKPLSSLLFSLLCFASLFSPGVWNLNIFMNLCVTEVLQNLLHTGSWVCLGLRDLGVKEKKREKNL